MVWVVQDMSKPIQARNKGCDKNKEIQAMHREIAKAKQATTCLGLPIFLAGLMREIVLHQECPLVLVVLIFELGPCATNPLVTHSFIHICFLLPVDIDVVRVLCFFIIADLASSVQDHPKFWLGFPQVTAHT